MKLTSKMAFELADSEEFVKIDKLIKSL
jgi:hypothetical protein